MLELQEKLSELEETIANLSKRSSSSSSEPKGPIRRMNCAKPIVIENIF